MRAPSRHCAPRGTEPSPPRGCSGPQRRARRSAARSRSARRATRPRPPIRASLAPCLLGPQRRGAAPLEACEAPVRASSRAARRCFARRCVARKVSNVPHAGETGPPHPLHARQAPPGSSRRPAEIAGGRGDGRPHRAPATASAQTPIEVSGRGSSQVRPAPRRDSTARRRAARRGGRAAEPHLRRLENPQRSIGRLGPFGDARAPAPPHRARGRRSRAPTRSPPGRHAEGRAR